jgi:hypothetical protein
MRQPAKSYGTHGNPFDWLKDMDKRASKLPPAKGVWEYPLFFFARYRRLRPILIRAGRLDKALHKARHESLAQFLSERAERITKQQETQQAVAGLTSEHRIQLAALLIDTEADIETFTRRKNAKDWSHKLGAEGPRRQRMLSRKLKKARASLSDLRQYATDLDPSLGFDYRRAADDALTQLVELREARSFAEHRTVYRELRQATKDPTTFAMVQLYWFFRSGCRLSGDEAEVRVALVRNAFWTTFGVARVAFFPKNQVGQSKGCQAVHEAVRRFCRQRAH